MPLVNVDIGSIASGLGTLARDLRAAITGKEPIDATKAAELALKAQELDQKALEAENALILAQSEITKVESASSSKWTSGWRPYIGWICGTVLFAAYVPRAIMSVAMWVRQVISAGELVAYPAFDLNDILGILGTILGAGWNAYLRTQEKVKGATK